SHFVGPAQNIFERFVFPFLCTFSMHVAARFRASDWQEPPSVGMLAATNLRCDGSVGIVRRQNSQRSILSTRARSSRRPDVLSSPATFLDDFAGTLKLCFG